MNKRDLIKYHLTQLSLYELLSYRLLFCRDQPNEDIELDISDLFKYPARLETSYYDSWQKDVLKSLFVILEGEADSAAQVHKKINALLTQRGFSEKDKRTLALFDDFLSSQHSQNVELLHSALQTRLNKLHF